jgi:hypothetical protein
VDLTFAPATHQISLALQHGQIIGPVYRALEGHFHQVSGVALTADGRRASRLLDPQEPDSPKRVQTGGAGRTYAARNAVAQSCVAKDSTYARYGMRAGESAVSAAFQHPARPGLRSCPRNPV